MGDSEFYSGSKVLQFVAAASANLGAFGLGTVLAWTAPGTPSLKEDDEYKDIDSSQESLLGSMVPVGALLACLITGYLVGKIGRKTTMLITSPPFVLGWLLIAFAQNFPMIVIGRFITGFCGGAFSLAAPVYIGETAESSLRGALGSAFQLMVVLGILFVYVFGYFMKWNWLAFLCGFIPAIFALCMFFMPESPRYFIIKGNIKDAANSLRRLRGAPNTDDIEPELHSIKASVDEASKNQASFKDLLEPSILKPVSISLLLMLFQQLSGVNAVIFYSTDIFVAAGTSLEPAIATICFVGIVQVVATVACSFLVDRAGRKILLAVSDILMAISLVLLGVFFFLKEEQNKDVSGIGWLPLVSMMLFIVAFSLGFGPIPWMMVGEILPQRALGVASSLATVFNWFLAFLVTQFFKGLQEAIGISYCFWIFAGVCVIGTCYILLIVPETKGKSIDEIQALFGGNSHQKSYNGVGDGRTNQTYNDSI